MRCNKCHRKVNNYNAMTCPHCNTVVCAECAETSGFICPNCADILNMLS